MLGVRLAWTPRSSRPPATGATKTAMSRTVILLTIVMGTSSCLGGSASDPGPVDESDLSTTVRQLEIPGEQFFPESVTASKDGTIYVGSFQTGAIVRFGP